jgi:hypothetical protein
MGQRRRRLAGRFFLPPAFRCFALLRVVAGARVFLRAFVARFSARRFFVFFFRFLPAGGSCHVRVTVSRRT